MDKNDHHFNRTGYISVSAFSVLRTKSLDRRVYIHTVGLSWPPKQGSHMQDVSWRYGYGQYKLLEAKIVPKAVVIF